MMNVLDSPAVIRELSWTLARWQRNVAFLLELQAITTLLGMHTEPQLILNAAEIRDKIRHKVRDKV